MRSFYEATIAAETFDYHAFSSSSRVHCADLERFNLGGVGGMLSDLLEVLRDHAIFF